MAKKKSGSKKETPFGKYKEAVVTATEQFIGKEIRSIGDWITSITHIKRKLRQMAIFMALFAGGVTITLYGLTRLLMDYFPTIRDGVLYIAVGIGAIVLSMIYKRL